MPFHAGLQCLSLFALEQRCHYSFRLQKLAIVSKGISRTRGTCKKLGDKWLHLLGTAVAYTEPSRHVVVAVP